MLNTSSRKDAYPLPRIDVCLDAMASAQWFSTFDLRSSYHQVQIEDQDMNKTAFICPRGQFRFTDDAIWFVHCRSDISTIGGHCYVRCKYERLFSLSR